MVQNQNKPADEVIPPNSNKIRLSAPPPPSGTSVYESILPNSIAYRPSPQQIYSALALPPNTGKAGDATNHTTASDATAPTTTVTFEPIIPPPYEDPQHAKGQQQQQQQHSPLVMPLVQYLAINRHLPIGWHRIHERRTRGVYPITSITTQLEGWERQLVRAVSLLLFLLLLLV
jgi:hypothetical protein